MMIVSNPDDVDESACGEVRVRSAAAACQRDNSHIFLQASNIGFPAKVAGSREIMRTHRKLSQILRHTTSPRALLQEVEAPAMRAEVNARDASQLY